MKRNSLFKKSSFLNGLSENLAVTAPFRKSHRALGRFIDFIAVVAVYIFKYCVSKISGLLRSKHTAAAVISLAAWAGLAAVAIYFFGSYSFGVKVNLGGLEMVVDNQNEFAEVLTQIEDDFTKKTGESFYFDKQPIYTLTLTKNNLLASSEQIYDSLADEAEISMGMSYGVFVDGTLIGTYPRETDLWELFDRVKALYSDSDAKDETVSISNDLQLVRGMYAKNKSRTIDELYNIFTLPADNRTVTVVKGDTLSDIAAQYGMTSAQLMLINPDYDFSGLKAGSKLYVTKPECQLKIVVERTVVYTREIAYKTITSYDNTMFETQSVVTRKGVNGITEYTDKVTLIDGEEITRETIDKTVLKAVTNRAVTKGTKSLAPTGSFICPINRGSYTITSYFYDKAYYKQFGSWHQGIDYGARTGIPILAADSGVVIFSGWTSPKGFGYLVKIQHQTGVITYYGHCSKLAVKNGEKVYQGQVIAYVGSTGNSTGPHLHFEIRVNGEAVNPLNYIK